MYEKWSKAIHLDAEERLYAESRQFKKKINQPQKKVWVVIIKVYELLQ